MTRRRSRDRSSLTRCPAAPTAAAAASDCAAARRVRRPSSSGSHGPDRQRAASRSAAPDRGQGRRPLHRRWSRPPSPTTGRRPRSGERPDAQRRRAGQRRPTASRSDRRPPVRARCRQRAGSVRRDGAAHLRPRERVRRHLHAPRPAPPQPRRGRPLPVPPGRVVGPLLATSSWPTAPACTSTSAATPSTPPPSATRSSTSSPTTRPASASSSSCWPRPSSACGRRASAASSTCSRTTPTRPATATAATRTTSPRRRDDFGHYAEVLIPFFVSRQIYAGAGKVLQTARGAMYCIAQRAEHIWEGVSSATTRSRPIINTRDEPHADAERYRRLHVIVGDSNMSEYATFLKVGATVDPAADARGPVVRAAGHDAREPDPGHPRDQPRHHLQAHGCGWPTAARRPRSTSRASTSSRALRYAETKGLSAARGARRSRCGSTASPRSRPTRSSSTASATGSSSTTSSRPTATEHDLPLSHPRVALIDLQYHDVNRERGPVLPAAGARTWSSGSCTDEAIDDAVETPPQTTRARLRGEFIRRAKERKRDYTVDWVHLKLNDQAQRTVLCKDPFKSRTSGSRSSSPRCSRPARRLTVRPLGLRPRENVCS